jgi:hypothetical protein
LEAGTFSNHLTSRELSGLLDQDLALVQSIAIINTSSNEGGVSSSVSGHQNQEDSEQLALKVL